MKTIYWIYFKKISFHDSDKTKRIGLITIREFEMVIDLGLGPRYINAHNDEKRALKFIVIKNVETRRW